MCLKIIYLFQKSCRRPWTSIGRHLLIMVKLLIEASVIANDLIGARSCPCHSGKCYLMTCRGAFKTFLGINFNFCISFKKFGIKSSVRMKTNSGSPRGHHGGGPLSRMQSLLEEHFWLWFPKPRTFFHVYPQQIAQLGFISPTTLCCGWDSNLLE